MLAMRAFRWSSSSGKTFLATGSKDTSVKLWNVANNSCVYTLLGHASPVTALELLSSQTMMLASGAADGKLKVWDLHTFQCLKTLRRHSAQVIALLLVDVDLVASASADQTIRVWNAKMQNPKTVSNATNNFMTHELVGSQVICKIV